MVQVLEKMQNIKMVLGCLVQRNAYLKLDKFQEII